MTATFALFIAMIPGVSESPSPCPPLPTPTQLSWQRDELSMFIHFGMNTFTGLEWGDGTESPESFNPTELDAEQWVRTAKKAGFRTVILTAKHHDGFCLWPTTTTEHCVRNAPWRGGKGDVVREFTEACRRHNVKAGLYLSPWDRHEPTYEDFPAYDTFYQAQLTELLTHYGPIAEVWFDGAPGSEHTYNWESYDAVVRRLQPEALIAICGHEPDIRWVGNEDGFAREDSSSVIDHEHWAPFECDVSIRPGWFWRSSENDKVKSLEHLLDIYYRSAGLNSSLLLNVPPDNRGLFCQEDIDRLLEWRSVLDKTFATDLARTAESTASSIRAESACSPDMAVDGDLDTFWAAKEEDTTAWLELALPEEQTFNVISLREHIALGERVRAYRIEIWDGNGWTPLCRGVTIGNRRLHRLPRTTAQRVRLVVEEARACPLISEIALHLSPVDR